MVKSGSRGTPVRRGAGRSGREPGRKHSALLLTKHPSHMRFSVPLLWSKKKKSDEGPRGSSLHDITIIT